MPNENQNATKQTAWHGAGHPAESHPCPTCNANPAAPCTSTVGLCGHGATGAPLRGLHAARVLRAENARAVVGAMPLVTDTDTTTETA